MVADPVEGSLAWWHTVSGKCDRLEVCAQHPYVTFKLLDNSWVRQYTETYASSMRFIRL